jgi:hypothetical protein
VGSQSGDDPQKDLAKMGSQDMNDVWRNMAKSVFFLIVDIENSY